MDITLSSGRSFDFAQLQPSGDLFRDGAGWSLVAVAVNTPTLYRDSEASWWHLSNHRRAERSPHFSPDDAPTPCQVETGSSQLSTPLWPNLSSLLLFPPANVFSDWYRRALRVLTSQDGGAAIRARPGDVCASFSVTEAGAKVRCSAVFFVPGVGCRVLRTIRALMSSQEKMQVRWRWL